MACTHPLIKNQIPTTLQKIIRKAYFSCLVHLYILDLLYVLFNSLNPITLVMICTVLVSDYFSESLTVKIMVGL